MNAALTVAKYASIVLGGLLAHVGFAILVGRCLRRRGGGSS